MTGTQRLERELGALRLALIKILTELPEQPTGKEIAKANGRWMALRREAGLRQFEPGDAEDWFRESIFSHPQFARFAKLRTARRKTLPSYRTKQAAAARARRADPVKNAEINKQRRANYAAAKREFRA